MTMSNMTDFMDRTLDTCDDCDTVDHVSCVCEYSVTTSHSHVRRVKRPDDG